MLLNCQGRLLDLTQPIVMGILNVTPDSFYDGGRYTDPDAVLHRAEAMLGEGAVVLDVGGESSRPGAEPVTESEELRRVLPAIEAVSRHFPEAFLSVDTVRWRVAVEAVQAGAHLINDISAGIFGAENEEKQNLPANTPYVLMHMQGTPRTMQQAPAYTDVVQEVLDFFIQKVAQLRAAGVYDVVLDPGFGFGKTVEHNYTLLKHLGSIKAVMGLPMLVGLSRKSMVNKPLGIRAAEALNGTTALHMLALQQGADMLRVHDVREAVQTIRLWQMYRNT